MIDDEKIIEMFFERSEQGMRELDIKYGKVCHKLSCHIVGNRWDAIPPARPNPLLSYLVKIVRNISLKIYWRKEAAKRSSHYTIALEEIEGGRLARVIQIIGERGFNMETIKSRPLQMCIRDRS